MSSAELDISALVSKLMQQEFRRQANFENKMLELSSRQLEETHAMRQEIASFIQKYRRQSLTLQVS